MRQPSQQITQTCNMSWKIRGITKVNNTIQKYKQQNLSINSKTFDVDAVTSYSKCLRKTLGQLQPFIDEANYIKPFKNASNFPTKNFWECFFTTYVQMEMLSRFIGQMFSMNHSPDFLHKCCYGKISLAAPVRGGDFQKKLVTGKPHPDGRL